MRLISLHFFHNLETRFNLSMTLRGVIAPSAVKCVRDSTYVISFMLCSYWVLFVMWSKQNDGGLRCSAVQYGVDFQSFSTHTGLYNMSVETIKKLQ